MAVRPRTVTAEEALAAVDAGMTVAAGSLSAEPIVLLEALGRRCAAAGAISLISGMLLDGYAALAPHLGNDIRLLTWFMPQALLGDVEFGPNVEFLPLTWVQTYRFVEQRADIDVCLIQVSPADESGFHSVGISASLNLLLARRARIVIAQVNPAMPFTSGDTCLHESDIDYLVEHEAPLRAFPHRTPDEKNAAIAAQVATLVPDGVTIQGGIGTVPESVLRILASEGREGLRITSILTDAGRGLIEAGCCVRDGPAAVVGEVLGSQDLYRWVHHNPNVVFRDVLATHGLPALAAGGPFVSINSTLEVDLYGQLNSEVIGRGQAGGIGGSIDFMMAAQLEGNRSVIALPSTTARGRSKIVPVIDRGLVTVPRTLVQYVVTEYGIADLRGRTARERALALIEISHPDHRAALHAELHRF